MGDIGIRERSVGQVTILNADGEVRIGLRFGGSSVPLSKAVDSLLEKGANRILLNLEAAGSINARGLGEIVSTYVTVRKSGGEFKLSNLKPLVCELMITTKLMTVFDVYESESLAVASFLNAAPAKAEPAELGAHVEPCLDRPHDGFDDRVLAIT